jgi:hypothetical protein
MLNDAVKEGAKVGNDLYGNIAFVDGIADGFYRHGMCADDRYINTPSDAAYAQGDDGGESWLLASLSSTGLAHPNRNGYLQYAQEILERIDHLLFNEPPVGNGELLWTTPGVTLKHMLLNNDFDPDVDDQLYARLATPPKYGSATVEPNGKLTYVPNNGFSGGDSLFYEVSDGEFSRIVKVNINVEAPVVLEPFVLGGTVTAIDGLLGHNELTGPYRVEIDRQPRVGLARPESGDIPPRIWYEAPTVSSPTRVEIAYTVWSETLDRDSPSFEAAVQGTIMLTIQPPSKRR